MTAEREPARAPHGAPSMQSGFAQTLPELSLPWQSTSFPDPRLLVLNESLAAELGLDAAWLRSAHGVEFLIGAETAPGSFPVAQAYAGHQFGSYAPRLGDGRALLLGEIRDAAGGTRDLHLKGSGRTRFSRGGDGFAAVGPMLREYLMGEAMHALGIPTTRAIAVLATGGRVLRDESLDPLPGAVLVRTASSHLRVGSFQFARSLDARTSDRAEVVRRLADFAIDRHCPEVRQSPRPVRGLLRYVIATQAKLIASWVCVGFVHGVMNTDNTTISGETIDYGPCAFIDAYDPGAVFSSIDVQGRYAYGRQPEIMLWNLTRFAESLLALLAEEIRDDALEGGDVSRETVDVSDAAVQTAVAELERFGELYDAAWIEGMAAKLGLAHRGAGSAEVVRQIGTGLLDDLQRYGIDFTGAFRALTATAEAMAAPDADELGDGAASQQGALHAMYPAGAAPGEWFERWLALQADGAAMRRANPIYVPRNHLVDAALEAATAGDMAPFTELLAVLMRPYEARADHERFARPAPAGTPRHVTYCGT